MNSEFRQLFLDDEGIGRIEGLERVLNEPDRHPDNPLLEPDTPWERGCQVYGTALYDEADQLFKLYYLTGPKDRGLKPLELPGGHVRAPHTTLAAYAISKDGVEWEKPALGQFPYDGDTQNNLLNIGRHNCEGIEVLNEPDDPDPYRRWKAFYWDHGSGGYEVRDGGHFCKAGPEDGAHIAFSPDGLHWKPYGGNPVIPKYCDTNQNALYDPQLKKYVAFSRFGFGRRLARSESEDFMHWSEPELVLECDEDDGEGTQIYGAGVDIYEGLYLAMVWIYREGIDGKINTQLAASRDGFHWTRAGGRATWLKLGDDDGWEGGMVRSVARIIPRGDRLYIYYCGVHGAHTGPKFKKVERKHPVCTGLVTQRRDGFVSLDAGGQPGSVLTKAFVLPEGKLHINADASAGSLELAFCDRSGRPLEGFESSQAISIDTTDSTVRWLGSNLDSLCGRTVCLRFTIHQGKLFSYWFST